MGLQFSLLLPVVVFILSVSRGAAQERPECPGGFEPQGTVVAIRGDVTARSQSGSPFQVSVGTPLCPSDRIATGSGSSFNFRQAGKNTVVGVSSNAVAVIPKPETGCVTLFGGILSFISSVTDRYCFRTPYVEAGIEGTEAVIAVGGSTGDSLILVREGEVTVRDSRDPDRHLLLKAEQADGSSAAYATRTQRLTAATSDNVPVEFRDLLLRPEGATDWAVYFPPILFGVGAKNPAVREASRLLDAGDPEGALRVLSSVQIEGPDGAIALALRAVIAVSRNDAASGRVLADQAAAVDPGSAIVQIARSYTLQGVGQLDLAREAADAAVAAAPDDAYVWARLAELELTVGNRRAAGEAVTRSLEISETALGLAIRGFVILGTYDFASAEADFETAIRIDSNAPLPRLGLGLTYIRQGRVAEGRLEIETAVALDPRRAILRTWLGRAYLEERKTDKAGSQFGLAAEADPDDPNTHLYSALALAERNDPVGALRELEIAEAVGGRRSVVRSLAGLAEDAAVRSVAAGRVFDQLGFEVLSTQKAALAVDQDPISPEAHRFLFDSYRGRPGYEIAQTSELMKYRLLEPPSNQLVQPSLSAPDPGLLTIPGVSRPTFYEFSPLFNRNGFFAAATGTLGNNDMLGDEVAFSFLKDNFSLSVGQFHFEDNGFRYNDEVEFDVVSAIAKYAPSPDLTLTAEARARRSSEGNRFPELGEDPMSVRKQDARDSELLRLGLHATATGNLDLIAVGTYSRLDEENLEEFTNNPDADNLTQLTTDSYDFEAQGIYGFGVGHVTAGAKVSRTRGDGTTAYGLATLDREEDRKSLYVYSTVAPTESLELTAGLSWDQISSSRIASFDFFGAAVEIPFKEGEISQLNPKLGLRMEVADGLVLRGIVARTLKPVFISDEVLEPTTIAGFSQFFDDWDYTDAWTTGVGADVRVAEDVWMGAEYLERFLEIPGVSLSETSDGTERRFVGYANATIGSNWALSGSFEYSDNSTERDSGRPGQVKTFMAPLEARYFHASGFFAAAEAIFFDQQAEGTHGEDETEIRRDESGVVVNGAIGYRSPNNRALVSLEIDNLLDNRFTLQNSLINSARPSTRPLAENLTVSARLTVSF